MAAKRNESNSSSTTAPNERELIITRIFDAPRSLVFKAWTDATHLARWWGPKGFTNPVCEIDLRPGGALRIVMRGPDGVEHPMIGVFREIVEPERLVFTNIPVDQEGKPLADGLTIVTFAEEGGKTKLTLQTRAIGLAPVADRMLEGMEAGWTQSLERLGDYVFRAAANSAKVVVRISRHFTTSAERVFDAWLNPASIGQWMFGPVLREEEVVHIQVAPHVGGRFSFLVRRHGTEMDHVGSYREFDRPRRLVFSWGIADQSADESVVTIDIRATETGCELTLTHEMDAKWADYASRTEAGWTKILSALAESLAKMA